MTKMTKDDLIGELEDFIEEEEDGLAAYESLLKDLGEDHQGVVEIIKAIMEDEAKHIQQLMEAISVLED